MFYALVRSQAKHKYQLYIGYLGLQFIVKRQVCTSVCTSAKHQAYQATLQCKLLSFLWSSLLGTAIAHSIPVRPFRRTSEHLVCLDSARLDVGRFLRALRAGEGHPPAIRYVYMGSATEGGFELGFK